MYSYLLKIERYIILIAVMLLGIESMAQTILHSDPNFRKEVSVKLKNIVDNFNARLKVDLNADLEQLHKVAYFYSRDTNILVPLLQRIDNYYDSVATDPSKANDFLLEANELFYKTASPYASDEALITILNKALQRTDTEDIYKTFPQYLLNNIDKNRVGKKVSDFEYLAKDSSVHKMSDLGGKYIILLFGSEGCVKCDKAKRELSSKSFKKGVEKGDLSIIYLSLTINLKYWQEKIKVPSHFIKGFDINRCLTELTNDYSKSGEPIYHIKEYPILYLIDAKSGIVLAKEIAPVTISRLIHPSDL